MNQAKRIRGSVGELRAAAKAFLADEWRCTVDWGSREERDVIRMRLLKAIRQATQAENNERITYFDRKGKLTEKARTP